MPTFPNLFMFSFYLSLGILLSHDHAVFLRGSPCLLSRRVSGEAVVNFQYIKPRNDIRDKLCV